MLNCNFKITPYICFPEQFDPVVNSLAASEISRQQALSDLPRTLLNSLLHVPPQSAVNSCQVIKCTIKIIILASQMYIFGSVQKVDIVFHWINRYLVDKY